MLNEELPFDIIKKKIGAKNVYKTKTNDDLLKKYNPVEIGVRLYRRMNEIQISVREFERALHRLLPSPYSSLRKFISYADIKQTNQKTERSRDFYSGLGSFVLSYALSMYVSALILQTDTYYLATGQEFPQYGSHFPLSSDESMHLNDRILYINNFIMSRYVQDDRGMRLRICRENKNYSIKQLADLVKLSPSTVFAYENSDSDHLPRYSYPILMEIATVLEAPADFIVLGGSILDIYHIGKSEFNPTVSFDIRKVERNMWEDMQIQASDEWQIEENCIEMEEQYREAISLMLPVLKIDTLEKIDFIIRCIYPDYEKKIYVSETELENKTEEQ